MAQRLSAVYMLSFVAYLLAHFAFDPPDSYASWSGWVAHPGVSLAMGAFFCALLAHVWVGVRDVMLDYVRPVSARPPALLALAAGLLAMAAWLAWILLRAQG
jgi:succinate dehydrogenase / fumarate reductase membrane anchor subunit